MESEWPARFAVGLDKDKAAIPRRLLRPVKPHDVVVIAALCVFLFVGSVLSVRDELYNAAVALAQIGTLFVVVNLVMGFFLWRTLSTEFPFPDDAFHLTGDGVTLFVAGAVHPVRLPWEAVRSLEIRQRRVRWTLTVTLADDPGAATGLDQPTVQRALLLRNRRARGLWFDVDALTQSFIRVDAAMRHYSGGRVSIHNPYRRFLPEHH